MILILFDCAFLIRREQIIGKDFLHCRLRKMMEHGMGGHLSYIWQPARPQCPEGHNEIPAPVALNEFSPALFSLFMGIAVALFVMLIEMYIEHRKRRRQRILLEPLEVFSNSGISDLEQFDFHKIEPND